MDLPASCQPPGVILPTIEDPVLRRRVQARLDAKTKPRGALGRLEALALQCAMILRDERARLREPQLVVFAADHGIAAQGVSAYPREVTRQMVLNFLAGGAAVSVLARQHGLALTVADCGVAADFAPQPGLARLKVSGAEHGAADSTQGPAMTVPQCEAAIAHGRRLVAGLLGNVLLLGEMGIGNTSAAALLMARLTGEPLQVCVGRGTGLDDEGLQRKREVLDRALQRHATSACSPREVLAALGGLEIATMTGAVLQAAEDRRVILVDGFISTAAVAVAAAEQPTVLECCVFSHCSAEGGHARWLRHLGAAPLLDLGLRLGEGSGAALAWPLLASACRLLDEMASFDSAGVSGASRDVNPGASGIPGPSGASGASGTPGLPDHGPECS
jgi:nicotinate-nucleotide--dimethylbenzimidazole phosphoribosyltransferase